MKVKDLMSLLQNVDPDFEVVVLDGNQEWVYELANNGEKCFCKNGRYIDDADRKPDEPLNCFMLQAN